MRPLLWLGSACIAVSAPVCTGQAIGQVSYPPGVQPADVQAAVASAMPPVCPVLLPDTLTGSVGTQPQCTLRQDATRPTVIQATTVITASDGSFSGTWPTPFASTPVFRSAQVEITSAQQPPIDCSFIAGTVTATGFTGKCAQLTSTTLPTVATSLLGLVVSPIVNAAGGQTVRIVGRQ